jgi:hypothetical protein
MDTNALVGNAINRSHAIEKLLRKHYPAAKGHGLRAAIKSLNGILPAILTRAIGVVVDVRNKAAHPDRFKPDTVPPDFDRLCEEIEWLIPNFMGLPHAKPAPPPKVSKPPAPMPRTTAVVSQPQNQGVATNVPANRGKPWTDQEDKMLVKAFDARTTLEQLAKAHQRGIGGIQSRLTKLGKLPEPQ